MARKARPQPQQPDADQRISLAMLQTFSTPAGKLALDYLRASFVNTAMSADVSDAQLRYREGQRSIVGIIDQRMKEARDHATRSVADDRN